MRKLVALIAMVLVLVACDESVTYDVVVTDDNHLTVWDSSGRGYTVPIEYLTIHGLENLPVATPTPKAQSTPEPLEGPAKIPTPVPGEVIDINAGWGNPFLLKQYEGRKVSVNIDPHTLTLTEMHGWNSLWSQYVTCYFPEEIPDHALQFLSSLELPYLIGVTIVGTLRYNDGVYALYECLPQKLAEPEDE